MPVDLDIPVEMCKKVEEFRNYVDSERQAVVTNHYKMMRSKQCVDFVDRMNAKYTFDKPRMVMSIRDCFKALETYVDSSDPDSRYV